MRLKENIVYFENGIKCGELIYDHYFKCWYFEPDKGIIFDKERTREIYYILLNKDNEKQEYKEE